MSAFYDGAIKVPGFRGDYIKVAYVNSQTKRYVMIRAVGAATEEHALLAFSPDQARTLAREIIEAANLADGAASEATQ